MNKYQKDLQNSKAAILQAIAEYAYSRIKLYIQNTVGKGRLSQHWQIT
jgi:hypothetical protein